MFQTRGVSEWNYISHIKCVHIYSSNYTPHVTCAICKDTTKGNVSRRKKPLNFYDETRPSSPMWHSGIMEDEGVLFRKRNRILQRRNSSPSRSAYWRRSTCASCTRSNYRYSTDFQVTRIAITKERKEIWLVSWNPITL